jgi:dienelactone hydrolase
MALLVVATTSTLALESRLTATSTLSADELWTKIGEFCGMPSWHPAVERCDLSADGKVRTLRFFGTSRTAVETLEARDDVGRSLAYAAESVTTSVTNYRTTVRVTAEAGASTVQMISSYDADGVPEADARRAVERSLYLSLCLNGALVCSGDQQSSHAEVVQFASPVQRPVPLLLKGYLRRPAGLGPFPAVVLLHGCGGFSDQLDQNWGVKIAAWGYVALTIDRYGPRGIKNTCRGGMPADSIFDAYRALDFLAQQPYVDPARVVVAGFSQGGWLSLAAVERGAAEQSSERKFRAAVAFYPVCIEVKGPMTVPTLIMIGERDDWTPADACRKLVNGEGDWGISRPKAEGPPIQLIVYPGAYHDFDRRGPTFQYDGHRIEFNQAAAEQSRNALRDFLTSVVGETAK